MKKILRKVAGDCVCCASLRLKLAERSAAVTKMNYQEWKRSERFKEACVRLVRGFAADPDYDNAHYTARHLLSVHGELDD